MVPEEELLERFGGDREFLREVAQQFSTDGPQLLRELEEYIEAGKAEEARRAAHGLKGIVASLGGERAAEAALEVEKLARAGQLTEAAEPCRRLRKEVEALERSLLAIARA